MAAYTPRAGDTVRDSDGELWFVYADDRNPNGQLYGINAVYDPGKTGQPIRDVAATWGPLRLEHRPTGNTTAIVGKDDTPEKKPLVVSDGKTYVLTRYHDNDDWFITAKPYTLPYNRVPVHQITATTNETGPSWERSIEAWLQAARESGHDAQNTGETVNHLNNAPTILVDGEHYVLTRHYDGHTVVTVDYKAVKTERGWVPA